MRALVSRGRRCQEPWGHAPQGAAPAGSVLPSSSGEGRPRLPINEGPESESDCRIWGGDSGQLLGAPEASRRPVCFVLFVTTQQERRKV
ncbi:unnamed protein product [Rangifer tarandus platyrhynchus]|uniref:Uncharacterized protein n=2 Tax=Rangifer tarandus platyrhynchus TaxID=3082113 RepID=A0ACB0F5I3_RANTA|nr:unnamed protein product [Rangifer tarandus platyrhynchus]CAI9708362.1 unnamed protein product [Rangifer tarandus platyrhynchus]